MEFRRVAHAVPTEVGEECLVLDASNGSCHILNETAGWLLQISEDFISLDGAVELATQRYSLPAGTDVSEQIKEALAALEAKGIVEIRRDA